MSSYNRRQQQLKMKRDMCETIYTNVDCSPLPVSNKDLRFLSRAIEESKKSNMLMRHGCVVTCNNKFISAGYNHYRNQFSDKFIGPSCSCHAEMDGLRRAFSLKMKGIKGNSPISLKVART